MLNSISVQVPWAMPSEIFPSSLRAKGVALATCSNWLNNFIIGLITPPLVINTGFGAYTFFAVFCLLSWIWTFYFVPETSKWNFRSSTFVFKIWLSRKKMIPRELLIPLSYTLALCLKEAMLTPECAGGSK